MVFVNLSEREKQAFFDLLDEYFASRPDLFNNLTNASGSGDAATDAAKSGAAAARRALASNPEMTASLVSAGLKHGVPKSSPYAAAASDPAVANAAGRFAAASLAFSGSKATPPPAPPRRTGSSSSTSDPPPTSVKPSEVRSGLTQVKKFGDVDMSSGKNMFTTLRSSTANKNANPPSVAPPIPSAFPQKKAFAPPPPRAGSSYRAPSPPPTPPEEEEEAEEEETGDWAEALYDYTGDPGDLPLKANQRVLVVEKTSPDWWTGTLEDGQKGLFPAAYVKML